MYRKRVISTRIREETRTSELLNITAKTNVSTRRIMFKLCIKLIKIILLRFRTNISSVTLLIKVAEIKIPKRETISPFNLSISLEFVNIKYITVQGT